MKFRWAQIKEFLSLPAGKQVVALLLLIVSGAVSVASIAISYYVREANRCQNDLKNCIGKSGAEKLAMQREYGDSIKVLLQGFERDKTVIYKAAIEKLEAREKDMDEALLDYHSVVETQRKTGAKLKTMNMKVSKLVRNANQ